MTVEAVLKEVGVMTEADFQRFLDKIERTARVYRTLSDAADQSPTQGTGFTALTIADMTGDGRAYEVWIRRAQ
jgi:hypothetical protein